MAVTHDMIAAKLEINRTTVTKALKGDRSIKKATRKKVLETATLLGYDFKQSQQNRREGKRYFIQEEVDVVILHAQSGKTLLRAPGLLTNLSSTGALLQVTNAENFVLPLVQFHLRLLFRDDSYPTLPEARVVRVTFYSHTQIATKFLDGQRVDDQVLADLEKKAFNKIDVQNSAPA